MFLKPKRATITNTMVQFDEEKEEKRLEDLRRQEEEELVQVLAQSKYGIASVNLANVPIENEALRVIPQKDARALDVAPFKLLGKTIHVAVRSPGKPEVDRLKEELINHGFTPIFYMASEASMEKVWERYKELSYAEETKAGGLDISNEMLAEVTKKIKSVKDVEQEIKDNAHEKATHHVSHMLEIILAGAIAVGASDVHIEPEETQVRLRFRLDGVLQDVLFFPSTTYKLLNSRLKLLSGMKLTSSNAQDGRFSIFLGGEEISMRTSMIPGAYGESIVMRILNPKTTQVKLEDLGIEPRLFEIIQKEIMKPHGMILLTGPTGSGKTTSLYSFLRRIYSPEIKIITIEDPIEYHVEGVTQTQVEEEKGYTFLEGLRSALRQDPDVIMVGEIRDAETAKIAVESALTGHMVFSTLHTNNAAGVIPRLIDLEVNPKILVSALTLSIAQRLVRKLCPHCRKEKTPDEKETATIKKILDKAAENKKDLSFYGIDKEKPFMLYEPVGCDQCNVTGYKGRIGVFEAIYNDESIEKIIPNNPSEREVDTVAQHQGILNMREDGVVKILKGVTSIAELQSVVDLEEELGSNETAK